MSTILPMSMTIGPNEKIVTLAEAKAAADLYPIVTIERGVCFAILRDTDSKSKYRAEIVSFSTAEIQKVQH
jgi:hypothetical protein